LLCCRGGQPREHIPPYTRPRLSGSYSGPIELLEHLLDLCVLFLDGDQRILDPGEALLLVGLVCCAGLVLLLSEVLDLLAAVLDFREAQRGRGSLEEVSERRQL
jgi:hypothetical protein